MTSIRNLLALLAFLPAAFLSAQAWCATPATRIEDRAAEIAYLNIAMQRDLLIHFQRSGLPGARQVETLLLRDVPTQSGMAYPKYYAWARVSGHGGAPLLQQGVVRLAEVDHRRFEITHFITAQRIRSEGSAVIAPIIPEPLHERVRALANEVLP